MTFCLPTFTCRRPIGRSKEKTVEAELGHARSRFASLQAELVGRNAEASRATAELRIATKKRDEARAATTGQGGTVFSVQRDFSRLFKVLQIGGSRFFNCVSGDHR